MKHKKADLTDLAWISRFWAQYSKLPEALKEGFCSMVFSITEEIEKEGTEQRIKSREQAIARY